MKFGNYEFVTTADKDGWFAQVNYRHELGWSCREKRPTANAAIIDAIEFAMLDEEFAPYAVDALAVAYAAGLINEFEPMSYKSFAYHGATYTVGSFGYKNAAVFRFMESLPINESSLKLDDTAKTYIALAKADIKSSDEMFDEGYAEWESTWIDGEQW